jgi:C_GCAxxG_C_C family probable redox protein
MNKKDVENRAEELFSSGFNCSQSVFGACAEYFGESRNAAVKTAAPFGGGIGRSGGNCGALSGLLMAYGLRHGDPKGSPEKKAEIYEASGKLMETFKAEHGSTTCKDLIGVDISTSQGRQAAAEKDTHNTVCLDLVRYCARLGAEL